MFVRLGFLTAAFISLPAIAQDPACSDGQWSKPVELRTADGRPVYIEPAPIARFGKSFVALASPSFVWHTPTSFMNLTSDTAGFMASKRELPWNVTRGGFVFDRDGLARPLDQPPDGSWMVHPRIFEIDSQTVVAIWAQDTAWNNGFDKYRIWSARLQNGVWKRPEPRSPLYPSLNWLGDVSTHTRADIPTYAATVIDSGRAYLLAGVEIDDRWFEAKLPVKMLSAEVHATGSRSGVVTMLIGHAFDRYGVAMLRLRMSGDSLVPDPALFLHTKPPTLLTGPNARIPSFPAWTGMMTRLDDDSLIALWTYEDSESGELAFKLRTEVSGDGGSSWTRRPPMDLGESADDLQLVITRDGDRHLIYRSQRTRVIGGEGSLRHLVWRSGTWHRVKSLANQIVSSRLGSGAAENGIVLTWTKSSHQNGFPVPQTVASWWTPGC